LDDQKLGRKFAASIAEDLTGWAGAWVHWLLQPQHR